MRIEVIGLAALLASCQPKGCTSETAKDAGIVEAVEQVKPYNPDVADESPQGVPIRGHPLPYTPKPRIPTEYKIQRIPVPPDFYSDMPGIEPDPLTDPGIVAPIPGEESQKYSEEK